MSFISKVAIVTGAASGIGAATVKALAREGAKVVLVDKDEAKLEETAKQCEHDGNKPLIIRADITKDEDCINVMKETIEYFGQIDVLVNNAGIHRVGTILDEKVMEQFDLIMNTNLRSIFYLTHLAAPYLIKTKGNIVNTASIGALWVLSGHMTYNVSKAGVDHFTRYVALDLAPYGVRVNAVAPGSTKTNILQYTGMSDELIEEFKNKTPLKKVAEPEEIADLIMFLASEKAKSITGSTYVCDNGSLLR